MRIYLDDVRIPKDKSLIIYRKWQDVVTPIKLGIVSFISFDHDLGQTKTGYDIALLIEKLVYEGKIKPPEYEVHSANPVGAKNIKAAMESAKRFYKMKKGG